MQYSIQEIAESLRLARTKKKLSQRELSAKIGVPQSHISKIENGMVDLKTSSLIEMARALDLELVLVPRNLIPAVQAMQNASSTTKQIPMYRLSDEEDEDDA